MRHHYEQAHDKPTNHDAIWPNSHRAPRARKTSTDVSLNSPTAPKVSPVTPPRRRLKYFLLARLKTAIQIIKAMPRPCKIAATKSRVMRVANSTCLVFR